MDDHQNTLLTMKMTEKLAWSSIENQTTVHMNTVRLLVSR